MQSGSSRSAPIVHQSSINFELVLSSKLVVPHVPKRGAAWHSAKLTRLAICLGLSPNANQLQLDNQSEGMSASEEQLKALRAQIKDGIRKIDETIKPKPFWQRVRAHIGRNQSNLTNVVLAGSLFAVAIGRYAVAKQLEVCGPVYGFPS